MLVVVGDSQECRDLCFHSNACYLFLSFSHFSSSQHVSWQCKNSHGFFIYKFLWNEYIFLILITFNHLLINISSMLYLSSWQSQESPLAYSNLLIKLEGLDDGVLDHYCQFVTSACKMMKLQVNKKYGHLLSSTA